MFDGFKDVNLLWEQQSKRDAFGEGMWDGKPLRELETCHLNNIVDMLRRRSRDCGEVTLASRTQKIFEIVEEIQRRQKSGEVIVHSKHRLVLTREMLLKLAQENGIPRGRGEIYYIFQNRDGTERPMKMRDGALQVRYDTQRSVVKVLSNKKKPDVKRGLKLIKKLQNATLKYAYKGSQDPETRKEIVEKYEKSQKELQQFFKEFL